MISLRQQQLRKDVIGGEGHTAAPHLTTTTDAEMRGDIEESTVGDVEIVIRQIVKITTDVASVVGMKIEIVIAIEETAIVTVTEKKGGGEEVLLETHLTPSDATVNEPLSTKITRTLTKKM